MAGWRAIEPGRQHEKTTDWLMRILQFHPIRARRARVRPAPARFRIVVPAGRAVALVAGGTPPREAEP